MRKELEMGEIMCAIIVGIVAFVTLFLWFSRFLGESGVVSSAHPYMKWCCEKRWQPETDDGKLTRQEAGSVFCQALIIRVVVYLLGTVICMLLSSYYSAQLRFSVLDFISSWNLWDSPHYIDLAKSGYQNCIENGEHLFLVFFPLYPWLIRAFHLFISNWEVAAMVISTLAFCIGSVFFYGTIKEEYNTDIAKRSFWLLSIFPFSFFFGGIMTESLFFCLLSAGFFYIRRHKWLTAGIIGIFCALCRVQGILLLGVGLVEFFVAYQPGKMFREKKGKEFIKAFFTKGIWLFLMPVGNAIYLWINYKVSGNCFQFQIYQKEHWYHTTTWMSNSLAEILTHATDNAVENSLKISTWYPEIVLFVLAIVLILYALRRHPLKYTAFLIVYTAVNYSVTFLISGGRYMACALPMFVILAEWTQKKPKVYQAIVWISAMLFTVYFAGYMTGQQIM